MRWLRRMGQILLQVEGSPTRVGRILLRGLFLTREDTILRQLDLAPGDVFDPGLAELLRANIYAAGDSRDPEALYTAFRGRLPSPEAMMEKRGL